jgi:hypothetical protein
MALIALERRLLVVKNNSSFGRGQYPAVAATWLLSIVMGGGPFVGFGSIVLHPSGTLCVSKWYVWFGASCGMYCAAAHTQRSDVCCVFCAVCWLVGWCEGGLTVRLALCILP